MARERRTRKPDPHRTGEFERLFLAADYDRCRELLKSAPASAETMLQAARLDLREGRFLDAVERLSSFSPESARHRIERDVWLGAALSSTGDRISAHRLLDRALELLRPPDDLYYFALFQKGYAVWAERDLAGLERLLEPLLEAPSPLHRARGRILRSWHLVGKRDLRGQAAEYLRALDELDSMETPDALIRLSTIFTLAALARELPLDDVADRVRAAYQAMSPSSGMRVQYFKLTRLMGWVEALRGNELAAFRQFRAAASLAPTAYWHVLCMADRAYLARTAGERAFAMDQLYAAHEEAARLSWHDSEQEDRMALLNLAELFAGVDPPMAQRYLALFRSLRTPMDSRMALASDPRVRALEAYPAGMALMRLGESDAAAAMLMEAYEIFREFDYGWRAALCALALYRHSREGRWLSLARQHASAWPNSWIAREVRQTRETDQLQTGSAAVSPAQQQVLQLLLEGKSNAAIASALGRSPHTIRNHLAEMFKIFGVRSRSELIARLSGRRTRP